MYTSFFPELKIRRVDVEGTLEYPIYRVYCSITTTNESEVPLWVEDEEFSNFISFFFFVWIEEIPDNFTGRRYSEVFFGDKVDPLYRLYDLDPGFDQLAFDRRSRNILKIEHKITMEEIKQQSLEFIEGVSITPEYGTTETLFEVEIDLKKSRMDAAGIILDLDRSRLNPNLYINQTANMIAYSHLDVDEFVSHYNITTGLDEIKRLGGNAIYQTLTNTTLGITTVSPGSENIVSYYNNSDTDPFTGFYDNDLFSTDRSPDIAPGLPDALSWKHNTNVQSILTNYGTEFSKEIKNQKIKDASIASVKDGSSCRLSENCWISLNESSRFYNYHFTLDMYSIIKNHSALGFLFNINSLEDRETGGSLAKRAFISSVVRKSIIKSMKVSRLRVENIPNTTNRNGNLIYENTQATENDACVYSSDDYDGVIAFLRRGYLNPVPTFGGIVDYDMSLEEIESEFPSADLIVPNLSRTFLIKDKHFFTNVTDGNYKYFIDLKVEDGFVKVMEQRITNLRNAIKTVKLLLTKVELFLSHSQKFSWTFTDEQDLERAIRIYVNNLGVLNLIGDQSFENSRDLVPSILNLVSPKRLGNHENINVFCKNLINLELQFLQILKSVGISEGFESTIENSFSKNGEKNLSSKEDNLISISIKSEKTLKAFNKNAIFIDFDSLDPILQPAQYTAIRPRRYITISEDDRLHEIANIREVENMIIATEQGTQSPEDLFEIREKLIILEQVLRNPDGGTFTSYRQQDKSISNLGNNIPGLSITLPRLKPPAEMISESDRNYGTFESSLIQASFELTNEQEFLHAASMGDYDIFQSLKAAAERGEVSKLLDSVNSVRTASSYTNYMKTEQTRTTPGEMDLEALSIRLFEPLNIRRFSLRFNPDSQDLEYYLVDNVLFPTQGRQLLTIHTADAYNSDYKINGAIPVNTVRLGQI